MSPARLHCTQCGRAYRPRVPVEGLRLCCAACGGGLAERVEQEVKLPRDPFRGRVIGRARLRKLLAVRPERRIYRATHRLMRTDVRVEVFPSEFTDANPEHMERLFRAAAATHGLRSTSVVTLLDIGRRSDCWFTVLEWTPSDLRELLDREGRLPVRRVLRHMEGVLTGLDAIQAIGLAHGNVTPEGVLLAYDGSPKLDRLGWPPRSDELERLALSPGGRLIGPALYLAPEVTEEAGGDIRSDLYSLGATAFEALAGRPPFPGSSAQDMRGMHAGDPRPDLHALRPEVPAEVAAFLERLMAVEPAERPAEPAAALEELRELGVELSRQRRIAPVRGSLTKAQVTRSAVRWTAAWSVVVAVLVAVSIVPMLLMCRQQLRGPAAPQAPAVADERVMLMLRPGGSALPAALPDQLAEAVRAVLRHSMDYYPPLEPADRAKVRALIEAGTAPAEAAKAVGAGYLLAAMHTGGLGRRKWTLTFARLGKGAWAVHEQCIVEQGAPDGLAPLERAAAKLLARASERIGIGGPERAPPVTGAGAEAWSRLAAAQQAERRGDWPQALSDARAAVRLAPQAEAFAVLASLQARMAAAKESGRFEAPAEPPPAGAVPPSLAGLVGIFEALAAGDEAVTQQRFADYLARFPRSARGYWLLGLWRLKVRGRPEEALVAFRHALDVDADYAPAAQGCIDVLAERRPDQLPALLAELKGRMRDPKAAELLEAYAERATAADARGD